MGNVTHKTQKTSIFKAAMLAFLTLIVSFLLVTEQLRRCGLETQRKGRHVSTLVKDKYGLWKWLVLRRASAVVSKRASLTQHLPQNCVSVCACLCVCVACLVTSRKKFCNISRSLNTLHSLFFQTECKPFHSFKAKVTSGYLAAYLRCFVRSDDSFRGC